MESSMSQTIYNGTRTFFVEDYDFMTESDVLKAVNFNQNEIFGRI